MVLLGRALEIARLQTLVEATQAGTSNVIFIEASAGLGKSSMLGWLRGAVGARPENLWSRVHIEVEELDSLRPLDPFHRAVDGLPAVGLTVADVVESIERLATKGPCLVTLDDLHWAHRSTLDAVGAIGTQLSDLPILLAVALRPSPRPPGHADLVKTLDPHRLEWLRLEPLADDAVARLVRSSAAEGADQASIVARAGGNPLLVEELARWGQELPGSGGEAGLLRRATLRRMLACDDETLDVVRAACILGRQSSVADVAVLTGLSSMQLVRALERANANGILDTHHEGVSFRHDVIREAVYEDLSEASRATLHLEAARCLSDSGASPAAIAPHLVRAAGSRDPEAYELLVKTAWAVQSTDRAVAVPLFERAVALTDPRNPQHAQLRAGLVTPLAAASRQPEAIALAREVLQEELPGDLAEQVRGSMLRALHRTGDLHAAISEGERLAAHVAGPERRRIEADVAYQKLLTGDIDGGITVARRLLQEPEVEDATQAAALVALSTGALAKGDVDEGLRAAERAAEIMRTATSFHRGVAAGIDLVTLGLALLHTDQLGSAKAAAGRGLRRELGESDAAGTPPYHFLLGFSSLTEGQWDDASLSLDTGLAVIESGGNPLGVLLAYAMAGMMAWGREGPAAALLHVERGQADIAANGLGFGADHLFYVEAIMAHESGRTSDAIATVETTWELGSPVRYLLPWTYLLPEIARVAMAAERDDLARSILAEAQRAAERAGTISTEAAVLRIANQLEDDAEAMHRATDLLTRGGRRFELARCCEEMTKTLRACKHPGAEAPARRAAELYRGMGADWFADRVLSSSAEGATAPRNRPVAGWGSLTAAELKVAELLVDGRTKADAAAALFLSPHTVDSHARSIYRKLGIKSRAQLATIVAAQRS